MAPCEHPDWRRGHEAAEAGKVPPNGRPPSKAFLHGYYYARKTLVLKLWCEKHGRAAVFDGPLPADDPLPTTRTGIDLWIHANGGGA
jgi:hypothetical protein